MEDERAERKRIYREIEDLLDETDIPTIEAVKSFLIDIID